MMPTSFESSSHSPPDPFRDLFESDATGDAARDLVRQALGDAAEPPVQAASWSEIQQKIRAATAPDHTAVRTTVPAPRAVAFTRSPGGTRRGRARRGRARSRRVGAWATGLAAVVGVVLLGFMWSGPAEPRRAADTIHEHATARGQRATVTLPGGATVVLAPESRFQYSEARDNSRIVELNGAAVFTVPHASTQPFIVRAAGAETRVLGTQFLVRRYADDSETKIVVTEGRVGVTATHMAESNVVTAGEMATVQTNGATQVIQAADLRAELGWMEGELRFVDTPLRQVVADLVRTFNMDVRLATPSLGDRPITAVIPETMRVADAIRLLAGVASLQVSQQQHSFLLSE